LSDLSKDLRASSTSNRIESIGDIRSQNWVVESIAPMHKKLSSLVLLLCSSCTHAPIELPANSQLQGTLPTLALVRQAEIVEIANDWNGYSDITPILRRSKLRRERQELVGNSHIAVGGYGAAGIDRQQTTRVKIPAAVSAKFLETLAKTPLQVGNYQPKLDRNDDYPSIEIQIKVAKQQVIFSSQSQGSDYMPWKVSIRQANKTSTYISNSPLPAQALKLLTPYLDSSGIDRIIQRRYRKK
jgi:hypothetical protein